MQTWASVRLTRSAAIQLISSVGLVLLGSTLVLWATSWNDQRPHPPEPYYTELPGVDLRALSPGAREVVLKRLNVQRCPCECGRTVASCRVHHGCSLSLAAAQEAVNATRGK